MLPFLWILSIVLFVIVYICITYTIGYFKASSFFNIAYDFYHIEEVAIRIHLIGGIIPILFSLIILLSGISIKKTGFLRRFVPLFIGVACLYSLTTFSSPRGITSELALPVLVAFGPIISLGCLKTRKGSYERVLPLMIYSSIALGVFMADILLLPSYIQWSISHLVSINILTIGGAGFLDGIFLYSLCGFLSAFFTTEIGKRFYSEDLGKRIKQMD